MLWSLKIKENTEAPHYDKPEMVKLMDDEKIVSLMSPFHVNKPKAHLFNSFLLYSEKNLRRVVWERVYQLLP